ncbi:MAG: hypothetical protein ACC700_18765, partial [Anaerolineales bacterium]
PADRFEWSYHCSDKSFTNARALKRDLRRHLPGYTETSNVFPHLWGRTEDALKNAETLRARATESWDECPNPSTMVDSLVSHIIAFQA